jgi:hypothetical protein
VFVLQPKGGLLLNDGGEQQGGKGERVKVHKDVPIACHERGMSHKARQRTNTTADEKSLVRDVRRSSITRGESLELHSSRRLFEVDLFVFLSKSRFTDRLRTQRRAQLFIIKGIEKTCSLKVS